jgi:replication-associated recombination protein RarA
LDSPAAYQVLARKYRPRTFADLIGQEAMVRTLGTPSRPTASRTPSC